MQRCPACNARLGSAPVCPRCGAELSRILRSERLGEQWLSVTLQSLGAGRVALAAPAVMRSLSFKQTPAGHLLKGFLIKTLYRMLYDSLGSQHWQEAAKLLGLLRCLQGENPALTRFAEMIGHLSTPPKHE
ncbi:MULTISPECIES: hypothetical protein [Methylomonas]|uniref:hypothetical protein n=1 Tax=Methylomonas TaxID=416 RepID=UPI0016816DD7|nr:hypothetical protein [Methylomonas rhizoryzae]